MVFKLLGLYHSKHGSSSSKKQNSTIIEELCHRFSLTDIRKSTNNFDESQIIGEGYFAKVYRGYLKCNIAATDCIVAVKRMKEGSLKLTLELFRNEIEITCQLNHPNIVSPIGFCHHKDEKIIVYEYMSNGSLAEHLHGSVIEPLSWKKRLEICIGIAHGLHYLHSGLKRTIIHRDVKPSNILLDSNMVPKLTEFGLSLRGPHFLSKPKPVEGLLGGTFGYIAPECLRNHFFSDKSDVYAFGVILLQVVCARRPIEIFDDTCVEEKIDPVLNGKIEQQCWEIYISTAKRCLNVDPNERPTMSEVEVELEQTLRLQEQANIRDNNAYYTLLSNTIIDLHRPSSVDEEPELDIDEESTDTKANKKGYAILVVIHHYMVRLLTNIRTKCC